MVVGFRSGRRDFSPHVMYNFGKESGVRVQTRKWGVVIALIGKEERCQSPSVSKAHTCTSSTLQRYGTPNLTRRFSLLALAHADTRARS